MALLSDSICSVHLDAASVKTRLGAYSLRSKLESLKLS